MPLKFRGQQEYWSKDKFIWQSTCLKDVFYSCASWGLRILLETFQIIRCKKGYDILLWGWRTSNFSTWAIFFLSFLKPKGVGGLTNKITWKLTPATPSGHLHEGFIFLLDLGHFFFLIFFGCGSCLELVITLSAKQWEGDSWSLDKIRLSVLCPFWLDYQMLCFLSPSFGITWWEGKWYH